MSKAITEAMVEAYRRAKNEALNWCGRYSQYQNRHYITDGKDEIWSFVSDDYNVGHSSMMTELHRLRDEYALSAALSAAQAQPVAIKPLEWSTQTRQGWTVHVAKGLGCTYEASAKVWNNGWMWGRVEDDSNFDAEDEETAKAAAQSDYESRIRSALSVPLPEIEGGDKGDGVSSEELAEIDPINPEFTEALSASWGVIETFEKRFPELYWHVAKGKICAGEPLYGAIITTHGGTEIGHGESDVSADDAFSIAVNNSGLSLPSAPSASIEGEKP